MRRERLSLSLVDERRGYFLIVGVLVILCLSQAALAQSGRRQSKNISPSPPVIVEAKTEGEAQPPTAKPTPVASLIIGGDRLSTSIDIPLGSLDLVIASCIEKLEKASSLVVTSGGNNMNRKDAIDKAKKQEKAYVVWLELKVESYSSDSPGFILEYSVLEPQTAKLKTSGHVYLDRAQVRNGPVGVGLPPSASRRLSLDYLMRQGGQNVAERMIDIFLLDTRNK
jgi:hypothetical protein